MNYSRKEWIKLSAAALGGLAVSDMYCGSSDHIRDFGIQMYMVRDIYEKDPRAALKQIASLGYKYVETYERNDDMFWGLGPKGYHDFVRTLGMKLISSHCEIEKGFEKKADLAAEAGMEYLIFNWPHAQQTMDEYKAKSDLFNSCGEICKKKGIKFAHHNYDHSFKLVEGYYPQDILMERTDPKLVYYQMDICWAASAGQNPADWFKKYPRRFTLCHVKDGKPNPGNRYVTTDLGKGSINLPEILKAAKENGMKYYFVEQEEFEVSSMESARKAAEYITKLNF